MYQTEPQEKPPTTWTQTVENGIFVRTYSDGSKHSGPPIFISQKHDQFGRYCFSLAYDERFVREFKRLVPGNRREWFGATSTWTVDKAFVEITRKLIEKYWEWPCQAESFAKYTERQAVEMQRYEQALSKDNRPALLAAINQPTEEEQLREKLARLDVQHASLKAQLLAVVTEMEAVHERLRVTQAK